MNECLKEISIYGKPMQMKGIFKPWVHCTYTHTQSAVTETHFRCCLSLFLFLCRLLILHYLCRRGTPVPHIRVYIVFVHSAHSFSAPPTHTKHYPQHIQSCYIACHMRPKSIWGFIYVCACVWCLVCTYAFPKCIVYFALTLDWKLEIDKIVDLEFWVQFLCVHFISHSIFYCWFSCYFVTHRPRHPTDRISMLCVLIVWGVHLSRTQQITSEFM